MFILPRVEREAELDDAIWTIHGATPLNELEKSLMRKALGASIEFADFNDLLDTDERYQSIIAKWSDWLGTCDCDEPMSVGDPVRCEIHKSAAACDVYVEVVDEAWAQIADWYLGPRPQRGVGPHIPIEEFRPKRGD